MAIYIMKPWYKKKGVELVPWSTGTDEQIVAILQAYYNNELSAEEIQALKTTYFPVGAKRSIPISVMAATGVSESHHADNYEYVIIGQEHDDLNTAINGKRKALITVQQDRIFYKNTTDSSYSSNSPSTDDEGGYIDFTNENGWDGSRRREWCNNIYVAALPQYIRENIKQVKKLTSQGNGLATIITSVDKAFLVSEVELVNNFNNSYYGEGEQYAYFKTTTRKNPVKNSGNSAIWWLRSPARYTTDEFCRRATSGVEGSMASDASGICPAFCL